MTESPIEKLSLGSRWLSRDPLKDVEQIEGPNIYIYVRNNVVNAKDPNGLGHWSFGTDPYSTSGDYTPVKYTLDDTEKCCTKAGIHRYVNDLGLPNGIAPWRNDDSLDDREGNWDSVNRIASAEGDQPDGPGGNDYIGYHLPWNHSFKFVAKCLSGCQGWSQKILSTTYNTFHSNGHWAGTTPTGYWEGQ
jgi:hypothetical protein